MEVGNLSPRTRHARSLFAGLPKEYDRLAKWLSFGQNGRWRRFMVSRVRASGAGSILDVATGTGGVAIALARSMPARVIGLDQSEPMLRVAAERVRAAELTDRIHLVLAGGEHLPFPDGSFDAVTFTYLLRYVDDPPATIAELSRVVRPGGTLANLEFHEPDDPMWRSLWWLYTRAGLPVAGRAFGPAWGEVGRFLGPSISDFYRRVPLGEQLTMWRRARIDDVRARVMSVGGGVVIWGQKGSRP